MGCHDVDLWNVLRTFSFIRFFTFFDDMEKVVETIFDEVSPKTFPFPYS